MPVGFKGSAGVSPAIGSAALRGGDSEDGGRDARPTHKSQAAMPMPRVLAVQQDLRDSCKVLSSFNMRQVKKALRLMPFLLAMMLTYAAVPSCAQGRFPIRQLRLPPGAKVVRLEPALREAMSPYKTYYEREWLVVFNHPGDWTQVSAHFDNCMRVARFEAYIEMTDVPLSSVSGRQGVNLDEWVRYYGSEETRMEVRVYNFNWLKSTQWAKSGSKLFDSGSGSSGARTMHPDYMVHVIRFRPKTKSQRDEENEEEGNGEEGK